MRSVDDAERAARAALSAIPPDESRDLWIRMGMALHAGFGGAGYGIWSTWSSRSEKWKEREGFAQWRSFRHGRGIGLGSLFHEAKRRGWQPSPEWRPPPRRVGPPPKPVVVPFEQDAAARRAAAQAVGMIRRGTVAPHPYLHAKGFEATPWLQDDADNLIVPMRLWPGHRSVRAVRSVQRIAPDGSKRFLHGGRVKGCAFLMRSIMPRSPILMCEGLATALSVSAALKEMSLRYPVAICFSASNMKHVARAEPNALVVGDCDDSGVGQRAARESGRPHWIPPEPGDANDLHQSAGIEAVIAGIRPLITAWWRR